MKTTSIPEDRFKLFAAIPAREAGVLLDAVANLSFSNAGVKTQAGEVSNQSIRKCGRVVFLIEDVRQLCESFSKLEDLLKNSPPFVFGFLYAGLASQVKAYKYEEGDFFAWHKDGDEKFELDQASKMTLLIYLNSGYFGGRTKFKKFEEQKGFDDVVHFDPSPGDALLFRHGVWHTGEKIGKGSIPKYVLRFDLLYK